MNNANLGQKVECDSCPWSGFEAELEVRGLNNDEDAECCPQCGELSISRLGFDDFEDLTA